MKKVSEALTPEKLKQIYYENTVEDAAKKLGCSITCLFSTLKLHNIPLKGRGGKKRRKLWIIG